jgi:cell division protease FtsH
LVFDDLTTGAESDIQNVTMIARGMVVRWGMSEKIGPVAVADAHAHQDGYLLPGAQPGSPATQELVDEEVRRIVDEAEQQVTELLERERARLDALAEALLDRETLDQADAYLLVGVEVPRLEPEEEAKAEARV